MFYAQALRTHSLPLDLNAATQDQELEKAYYESFDPKSIVATVTTKEENDAFFASLTKEHADSI